jgi:hypothetical protein
VYFRAFRKRGLLNWSKKLAKEFIARLNVYVYVYVDVCVCVVSAFQRTEADVNILHLLSNLTILDTKSVACFSFYIDTG